MSDDVAALQAVVAAAQQAVAAQAASLPQYSVPGPQVAGTTKYQQLLAIIEELGKDIRPTYTGNKICAERLKRSIIHARILVRECLLEADRDRQKSTTTTTTTSTST